MNGTQLTSLEALRAGFVSATKAMSKWLATNPAGWATVVISVIGLLTKSYDTLIGKQEALARTKIKDSDKDIAKYNEEISALEELQTKLEATKGNKSELSAIYEQLNNVIGETVGLLDGEGKAYDIANAKLKANIALKEKQREQAKKEKAQASTDLFNNNVLETEFLGADWLMPDISADYMRDKAHEFRVAINQYNNLSKNHKIRRQHKTAEDFAKFSLENSEVGAITIGEEWNAYWDEQVQIAYDAFNGYIEDYNGVGGQDFIKNLINNLVRGGSDWSEITSAVQNITSNEEMQNAINSYWESLVNPDINSEDALKNVKSMIDKIISDYPNLSAFFEQFYDGIASGGQAVIDTTKDMQNSTSPYTTYLADVESLSAGFEQLADIYSDVNDGGTFDFSSILNNADFKETFGDLEDEYNNFIQTITKSPDDIDACQGAFDDLAAKYIENSGVLNDLTEETKASTIAMLKQMGVANAEEVVTNALAKAKIRLAAKEEYLTASKELAEIKSNDLSNATYEEISALLSEGYASETTRQYLAQLALSKFNVNSININTQSDIDNIIALANAAGASTQYVNALETALNNLQNGKTTKSIAKNYLTTEGQFYIKSNKEAWAQEVATDAEFNARKALQNVLSSINENKLNASDFYTSINYQGGSASNTSSSSAQETKETFNWIETALSRIQRTITNLGKSVSATWKSWGTRNSDLAKQISAVNKELSLQQQAYNKYITLANSVGLSDYYKNLVHSGTIQYETITNASLAEKIKEYQDFYEQALGCEDAILDLKDELASLAQTNFDNITKQFEDKLSLIDHELGMLESTADLLETQGYIRSASIYDSLAQYEQENLNNLQSKYLSLMDALNNSGIEKGTEQWNDMYIEVLGVKEELLESQKALAEYNNTLQELNWEVFDKLQEKISGIRDESDFLIDLMANDKLFDDKGNLTEQGQATLGLHALNYNTYMAQAEEYAKELKQINADLAKDPYNQTLLERRDELLEQQREMIQAAEDEKESAIDLASEGYDTLLEYMDQLIEKRKDMLSQAKDLYDYEKNIAEQTKEVASLEKQLAAYQGDDSEESRATIQKVKVSLEEARENLEETEYDKYISDQEQMLDSLYSEAEEWINTRLDNEDLLLQNIIDSAKTNSESIMETLKTVTDEVGMTLSDKMEAIWSASGSVGSAITMMKDYIIGMQEDAEEKTDEIQASTAPSTNSTPNSSTPSSAPTTNTTASSSTTSSSWGSFFIRKADSYPKGKLNINTSIVDRLKYNDIDSSFSARSQYYSAMGGSGVYTGSSSQNQWMLAQMKNHSGFARGGIIGSMIRSAGEDGIALVRRGEGIIPTSMMPEWKALTQNLPQLNKAINLTAGNTPSNISIDIGDIQMYGVNDPSEFAQQLKNTMLNNHSIRKIMKDTTLGEALGKNAMIRYTR